MFNGTRNCHFAASALAKDIVAAGLSDGWKTCVGLASSAQAKGFVHSFLTFDGWMIDASNGHFFVIDAAVYAATLAPKQVRTFPITDLASWAAYVEAS